jgi:hypothetical protein
MENKKTQWILFFGIILLLIIYFISFFVLETPLRGKNYDTYSFSSFIDILKMPNIENGTLFPSILKSDLHAGINVIGLGVLDIFLEMENLSLMGLIGGIYILFFIFSLNFFLKKNKIKKITRYISLFLIFLMVPLVPSLTFAGKGGFSIMDLIFLANSPSFLACSLMFLALGLIINKKKFEKSNYFLFFIFSIFILNSSLLIGGILTILTLILLFNNNSSLKELKTYFPFVITISALVLASYFLNNNLITNLIHSTKIFQDSQIAAGTFDPFYTSFESFIAILSLSILGIPGIIKNKNNFLKYTLLIFGIISFSFLFPITLKIPMYWRFLPFLMLFSTIGLAIILREYKTPLKIVGIFLITLILSIALIENMELFNQRQNDFNRFQGPNNLINKNNTYLTDPITANIIIGMYGANTFIMAEGHITNPEIILENRKRQTFILNSNLKEITKIFRYNYIIIDSHQEDEIANHLVNLTKELTPIYDMEGIKIYGEIE